MDENFGNFMYDLAKRLFPICRSITGDGVRKTLAMLKEVCPSMNIFEVATGTKVFDWEIPKEWNIKDAWIKDSDDNIIVDFKLNNLHVVGYSIPVNHKVDLEELKNHIYTEPEQPDVIPFVTSYYKKNFGFCMSENQKNSLKKDIYHMFIDSELKDGSLTYGEITIPSTDPQENTKEIFLSTYICHPSMANNELSGPCVTIYLAKWISEMKYRRYNYRIVFIPETIGSITYLNRNFEIMKKNIIAGFNISCVGDNLTFSYIASRYGNTLADKAARNVLQYYYPEYKSYSYLKRGSDERQYNAPGIDLPLCTICRSKYGEYPEYHTSADNMNFISAEGLEGAYEVYRKCIIALENNFFYMTNFLCEPQLGKRGLFPTISQKGSLNNVRTMMDLLSYSDGHNDLIDISNIINVSIDEILPIAQELLNNNIISRLEKSIQE
jgi:aminopeptidase-like protein